MFSPYPWAMFIYFTHPYFFLSPDGAHTDVLCLSEWSWEQVPTSLSLDKTFLLSDFKAEMCSSLLHMEKPMISLEHITSFIYC